MIQARQLVPLGAHQNSGHSSNYRPKALHQGHAAQCLFTDATGPWPRVVTVLCDLSLKSHVLHRERQPTCPRAQVRCDHGKELRHAITVANAMTAGQQIAAMTNNDVCRIAGALCQRKAAVGQEPSAR